MEIVLCTSLIESLSRQLIESEEKTSNYYIKSFQIFYKSRFISIMLFLQVNRSSLYHVVLRDLEIVVSIRYSFSIDFRL